MGVSWQHLPACRVCQLTQLDDYLPLLDTAHPSCGLSGSGRLPKPYNPNPYRTASAAGQQGLVTLHRCAMVLLLSKALHLCLAELSFCSCQSLLLQRGVTRCVWPGGNAHSPGLLP